MTLQPIEFPPDPLAPPPRSSEPEADAKRIRDYDELLDTYSLHQFIIRKAKPSRPRPSSSRSVAKYSYMWAQVSQLIYKVRSSAPQCSNSPPPPPPHHQIYSGDELLCAQLEAFLAKFAVPMAYVNGQVPTPILRF